MYQVISSQKVFCLLSDIKKNRQNIFLNTWRINRKNGVFLTMRNLSSMIEGTSPKYCKKIMPSRHGKSIGGLIAVSSTIENINSLHLSMNQIQNNATIELFPRNFFPVTDINHIVNASEIIENNVKKHNQWVLKAKPTKFKTQ